MATPSSVEYELLTEHFGYPPVALLDDIINTVNVLADRALDSVERLLISIPPQSLGFKAAAKDAGSSDLPPAEAAKREIESGTHQLETLLNASIDKNFDLFELYTMRNILTVRPQDQPFMRLAHYEGLDFAASAPDRPTTESVNALRRRLQASQRLHVALQTERARNEALLRKLRASMGLPEGGAGTDIKKEEPAEMPPSAFGFLRNKRDLEEEVGTDQPIATTTEFTLSQLQALRSLSTSLRTILPDLGGSDDPAAQGQDESDQPPAGSKSWRRERSEYVESASRKYLEGPRGLELGDQGEVRDGEWQGEGRRLTKGEVESLEKAAALLRSSAHETGDTETSQGGEVDAMDES